MRIYRMRMALGLFVAVFVVTGCTGAPTPTPTAEVAMPDVVVATESTDASGYATVELDGRVYEVQLLTEDPDADLADSDVAIAQMGHNFFLWVSDPAGNYFPASELAGEMPSPESAIVVWLTPVAESDTSARVVETALDMTALSGGEALDTAEFLAARQDDLASGDFVTLIIELTDRGELPGEVSVYSLPVDSAYLLTQSGDAPRADIAHYVIVSTRDPAMAEAPDEFIQAVGDLVDDLGTANVPDWLIGSEHQQTAARLHWTYMPYYRFEGIACDTAGAAIEQVVAYLALQPDPELATYSTLPDSTSIEEGMVVVTSPAQDELWYTSQESSILTVWYCDQVTLVEEPVEEEVAEAPEEEAEEPAEEEAVPAEEPTFQAVVDVASVVRAGPGITYPVLTTLAADTQVTALGTDPEVDWVQIAIPDSDARGWIFADLLTLEEFDLADLPTIADIPAPPPSAPAVQVTPSGCVLPRIELWAAELAPEGADHVWQLVYRVSGATEVRIFDNVMTNPVAATFPIYGDEDANWVLTALYNSPGCYVERNIDVDVEHLPPAGTYSDPAHGFPRLGTGDVQVTLFWSGQADLDLHVIDPTGVEIYSGNMYSPTGGILDGDVNWPCGPGPSPVENVFWPTGGAPSGEYRVRVHYYRDCKDQGPVNWTLTVRLGGALIATHTGTITEGQMVDVMTFYR